MKSQVFTEMFYICLNFTINQQGFISSLLASIRSYCNICPVWIYQLWCMQLGGIEALAPQRRPALALIVMRALIAVTMACFMKACIAGGC